MGFLQGSTLRPVPDHNKLRRGMAALHSTIRCDGEGEIFLWCQPPYIEHSEVTVRHTPRAPQCRTAAGRGKQLTVDTSTQDTNIVYAHGLQLVAESDAGHEGVARTVMKPAEIVQD